MIARAGPLWISRTDAVVHALALLRGPDRREERLDWCHLPQHETGKDHGQQPCPARTGMETQRPKHGSSNRSNRSIRE